MESSYKKDQRVFMHSLMLPGTVFNIRFDSLNNPLITVHSDEVVKGKTEFSKEALIICRESELSPLPPRHVIYVLSEFSTNELKLFEADGFLTRADYDMLYHPDHWRFSAGVLKPDFFFPADDPESGMVAITDEAKAWALSLD